MKTRFLLLFVFVGLVAQAQTINVSGSQSGIWEADTVKVVGDVIVDGTLSIRPGTTVLFDGYYSISATEGASFLALGTETDSITFTVADTTGFHLFNFGRGGWNGIHLKEAGASRFEYCRFHYGKAALDDDQDGGALRIFGCDEVEISHSNLFCNFSREHGGALNAEHSKVVMHDCNVNHNLTYTEIDTVYFMYGGGLRFINCEVELIDMAFRYNDGRSAIGGALSLDSCSVNIDRCNFEHNHGVNGGGLYIIRCYDRPCRISNSLFANNDSSHFGGGLAISDSSPEVSNLTVVGNYSYGVTCGGIFFYQHSSPIVRNCIIYGNTNYAPLEEPVQMWIWTYDDYVPEFHNCLVQYGMGNISGNDIIQVYEDCIDDDPLFADTINENYRLSNGSPCVDAGAPDTPDTILNGLDLDGHQRMSGNRIDIGAYEYSNVGLNEITQDGKFLRIVGNPITEESYAELELEEACPINAKVYSIDGKLMVEQSIGNLPAGNHRIGLGTLFQTLPRGTYLVVMNGHGKSVAAKVIR
ncbi:MAG: right-handed parallel beta-helix repeat-containing protein [Bacteroidales bacterium]|nr:right-handed parallel beta-helix repeat-containing protein [Bacteroidales bacterium]